MRYSLFSEVNKMMDNCMEMDGESLDAKSSVLKKLIKELMLVDNPKRGGNAKIDQGQTVANDGDAAGEGGGEEEAPADVEVVAEVSEPVAEEEDIANYKRG
jgi:hypothetical protein